MLWGRITWGVYWQWDARLTTTALLFVTYDRLPRRARTSAGLTSSGPSAAPSIGLLAVIEIPLVHFSVEMWRSLHQDASIADPTGDVKMDGLMLFSLFVGCRRVHAVVRVAAAAPQPGDGDGRPTRRPSASTVALAARRSRRDCRDDRPDRQRRLHLGSYAITFAVVGAFAWRAIRHGRRLGRQIDDDRQVLDLTRP